MRDDVDGLPTEIELVVGISFIRDMDIDINVDIDR